jgi:hypothetical protein
MKNTLTKKANDLACKIHTQYDKLGFIDGDDFYFNRFHDQLQVQTDCAYEAAQDVEQLEKDGKLDDAQAIVEQLEDTLEYCKAIIKGQSLLTTLFKNCPNPVFG